ncbi:MAG: hypothetical protein A2W22_03725 [Candidatus Levybacteria bacterium RBG_16_35_11]|nr:MAG: hypothetical protein A2W22_03725 [Candidatus Levybacteria bacterium RBG_16_35_11]
MEKLKGCNNLCSSETNCIEFGGQRAELTEYYSIVIFEPIRACHQRNGIDARLAKKGNVLIYKRPGLSHKLREAVHLHIPTIRRSSVGWLRI